MTVMTTISTRTFITIHALDTVAPKHKRIKELLVSKYNPSPAKGIKVLRFEAIKLALMMQFLPY